MKKNLIVFIILMVLGFSLGAQENLEDPILVLPTIELEIEDLSVEHIEADLPDEAVLVPAERDIFLPEDIEVDIPEPDLSPILAGSDFDLPEITGESAFGAEALVGVGNVNALEGRLSFYKLGDAPRYRFDFEHRALDGFGFEQQGQGFSLREDVLSSEVKLQGEGLETEFSGSFIDSEQGLQSQGPYYSKINRFIDTDLKLSISPLTYLLLYGQGIFKASSYSFTGAAAPALPGLAYPPTELILHPEIGLELLLEDWNLGLSLPYSFRFIPGSEGYDLHRFSPQFWLTYQTPTWINLSASVGYYLNHHLDMLVPFEISLGGSPVTDFSFRFWGGLENQENDFANLWAEQPLSDLLIQLEDNHRWHGHVMTQFNITQAFRFSVTGGLSLNSILYRLSENQNPATGLLTYASSRDVVDLELNGVLRWKLSDIFSFNVLADVFMYFTNPFELNTNLTGEILAADPKGVWNVETSMQARLEEASLYNLPVWDLSAAFRIADNVIISGACEDILYPFLEIPRYDREPFIQPGIRGLVSVQINF